MSNKIKPINYFDYIKSFRLKSCDNKEKKKKDDSIKELPFLREYHKRKAKQIGNKKDNTNSLFERTFSQIEKSLSMNKTSANSFYAHQKKSINEYDKYVIKELIDKEKKKVIMNYRPKRIKITNKELKGIEYTIEKKIQNEYEIKKNENIKSRNFSMLLKYRNNSRTKYINDVRNSNKYISKIASKTNVIVDRFMNSFNHQCELE